MEIIKKKHITIFALLIISIFSFSITSQTIVRAVTIEGFEFSNNLVTGAELAWKLTKYEASSEEFGEHYVIGIKEGKNMSEGDVFKIKLLKDLNDLGLDGLYELYYTEEQWGEYYLNGVSIGKNASDIYWLSPETSTGKVIITPILPITVQLSTGSENYFDYAYENFASLPDNETEGITIKNTASTFSIKHEYHGTIMFLGNFKVDHKMEVVYNKDWGVIANYDFMHKVQSEGETSKIEILYETEIKEIQVPYSWTSSFIALFVTGIVVLVKRRKK
ncbi:MAG: hypothetical protein H7645_12155 [Candidatus Heimdallarchaeota archaeon]|nr:hypothetical protein [Candidatus Heimdallarchaeota archaeon]MCK4771077.1 hypothetical protein [Candidatus Heimdallarchaeota archaeon]